MQRISSQCKTAEILYYLVSSQKSIFSSFKAFYREFFSFDRRANDKDLFINVMSYVWGANSIT